MGKLNEINNRSDFANLINVPIQKLTFILYKKKVENLYSSFSIPKKSGGYRRIYSPHEDLLDIQKKIARLLATQKNVFQEENRIKLNISHGFEKNKSIITNAKIHRNKRFVFNVDLENFFESFHFGRVKGYFEKNKNFQLPTEVAVILAQLCCYQGVLPQGAPTSPIITNLICNILDLRLLKLAKKYRLDYTRYADDLTFSTNDRHFLDLKNAFYYELNGEIKKAGFKLNEKKSNFQYKDSRQMVTGLVVNKMINVDRNFYKETRAMAHRLYQTGSFTIDNEEADIKQLEGRFAFINQIQWYNNRIDNEKHNFRSLNTKEKQYQALLFYKYFFANNKPLIITEGKTDIKYLKSALKKYYNEYPELVTKDEKNNYDFKISFLRRSKRLRYFFDLSLDGADTLTDFYKRFMSNSYPEKGAINYLMHFKKMSENKPKNPVIWIFDNEIANKDKPICKFINGVKLTEYKKECLKSSQQTLLHDNLFLLTNPLSNGAEECEIEDLFSEDVLKKEINGKTFCRDKKVDPEKYYGKEIFSNFIVNEYERIDFENFKPMLDNLTLIVRNYRSDSVIP